MSPLEVDVVSSERVVWSGAAVSVTAPAADGEIGILPGHAPLLSVLGTGTLRVRPASGAPVELRVSGGFLSVDADRVTLVADDAEPAPRAATR